MNKVKNMNFKWLVPAVIVLITVLRLASIGIMGLMPQDAYYYFYSEHLSLSYFDHPPGIAYMLYLFTSVLGKKVFVIKMADSVVTLLSLFFFYRLAKKFLIVRHARNALILLFSTFMITILSLVSTPDVPLILFWILSLLCLYEAVFQEKKIYWIWSGITMGMAFDSKYTALLLPFGIVIFLMLSTAHRNILATRWFWLCVLFFLCTISPVIIWNVQHDFASFKFQSTERLGESKALQIGLLKPLGVIGHQSAILTPVLFFALVYFLVRTFKKYSLRLLNFPVEKLFLLCFFLPLFAGFISLSLVYWVKLNWMMPAYITGIILVTPFLNRKWFSYQLLLSGVIHIALAVEIFYYPVHIKSDDTWVGWNQLAGRVKQLQKENPQAFTFSADDYKTSAVLNFYLDDMVYSQNVIGKQALQFVYIDNNLMKLDGKDAIFIDSDPNFENSKKRNKQPPFLLQYFDSIEELNPLLIEINGQVVRKFLIYKCNNYHYAKAT